MVGRPIPLADRFDKHYIPEPNSGCWLWLSATIKSSDSRLYGVIGRCRGQLPRMALAHRASYELHIGAIPDKMQIDHKCQNTLCVNPEHLQMLTSKAHCQLTMERSLKGNCRRGHLMDAKNTWYEKNGAKHCRRCHADREAANRAKKKIACTEVLQ